MFPMSHINEKQFAKVNHAKKLHQSNIYSQSWGVWCLFCRIGTFAIYGSGSVGATLLGNHPNDPKVGAYTHLIYIYDESAKIRFPNRNARLKKNIRFLRLNSSRVVLFCVWFLFVGGPKVTSNCPHQEAPCPSSFWIETEQCP